MQVKTSSVIWIPLLIGSTFINSLKAMEKCVALIEDEYHRKDEITGKVIDKNGLPVIGITIKNQRTQETSITNDKGHFLVTGKKGDVLEVYGLVFQKQLIRIDETTNILIRLTISNQEIKEAVIDEVIVVGYSKQKKVNLTGAVDQINAELLESRPINNLSQGLVGASPNLNITMLDGKPTQSPAFNIRGVTSIGQGGNALVLIDGVEADPKMLNPNDVESISILKDAASSSIYGSRAAFGVVLITTKSAKGGKTSLNYNSSVSILQPTTTPDYITDSYPWAKNFNDSWTNWNDNGRTPTAINKTMSFSPEYLAEIKRRWEDSSLPRFEINPSTREYQYYSSTNWYKEMIKDKWYGQNHNISITGGGDKAQFYLSGRYNGQDGMFRYNSDDYSMYNTRAKGNIKLNDWLSIENNAEFSKMNYHQPINVGEAGGIWRNIADEGHPLAPLLNPDGTMSFSAAYTVGDLYYGKNARDISQRFFKNKTSATAKLFNNALIMKADFSFQNSDISSHQRRVPVPYSRFKGIKSFTGTDTNDLEERRTTTDYIATNIYAEYSKTIDNSHNIVLLGGINYERSIYKNLTTKRNGLVFEDADDINLAFGQNFTAAGGYDKWATAGGFFRANYNFSERYLLEFNGRYDGSSKFPTSQQWAFFPSASAGWRISKENFWKLSRQTISDLKLRVSYGSLGNGNINSYAFNENFNVRQIDRIINGIRPQMTSQPGVVPAGLTWETVTTGNAGLDIEAIDKRLTFSGDLYRRWTNDMFTVGRSLPSVFGITVPKGNYADLQTSGWEIALAWGDQFNINNKPFKYNLKFTLADHNTIITKYNNPDKLLTDFYEGQKLGEIWGYRVEGLFKSQDEINNSASQSLIPNTSTGKNYVGDLKFKDLNGDGVIYHGLNRVGDSGDKVIIGNSEARYVYGVNLSSDWNGFYFSALFQGVLKQDWYPSPESKFWGQYNRPYNAYPKWHENNMYREDLMNFDAYLPRLVGYIAQGTGRALNVASDRYLQNASYVRLRNLQIGYSVPENLISKFGVQKITIYFSGENLWTWSPMYKRTKDTDVNSIYGSDRDLHNGNTGDGYNYPMLRNLSLGLNINL